MISMIHAVIFGLLGGVLRIAIGYSKAYGMLGSYVPFRWKRASVTIIIALLAGALTPILIESDSFAIALIAGFAGTDLLEALAKGLMKLKTGFATGFTKSRYSEITGEFGSDEKINKRFKKALDYTDQKGKITNNDYEKINRVSDATASRDLSKMEKIGLIKKFGKGRNSHYKIK